MQVSLAGDVVAGVIWKRGYYMQAATHQVFSGCFISVVISIFWLSSIWFISIVIRCCGVLLSYPCFGRPVYVVHHLVDGHELVSTLIP